MNSENPPQDEEAVELCSSCASLNRPGVDFCQHCGAPIGATSNLDPIKRTRTPGFMLGRLIHGEATRFGQTVAVLLLGLLLFGVIVDLLSPFGSNNPLIALGVLYVVFYVLWRMLTDKPSG
ncbi:MAG: zinc ribbon domain-containing protein [Candidatus Hydrogenedentes bacterium]|nr:zinc ribbon domain-containing protein [Candidatus Hydrogenedentota bacterium]